MARNLRTGALPADYGSCGWWELLPPPAPARRVEGDVAADWLVIGAGVTGLATARCLAELRPDDRVVLLEARRVGYGSSGRNSGFIIDSFHWNESWGGEGNRRVLGLHRLGQAALRGLVQTHRLDCDWSDIGRYHVAVEAIGLRRLDEFRRGLELLGESYEEVSADALREHIGTDYYAGAIYTPGTTLVQPAALCRGLGEHLPESVTLYEDSPVVATHLGSPHRVETPGGSVSAKTLLLATNGFTPQLGFLRRRVLPLCTFSSLTRVLRESERERTGHGEWGLVSEEKMGSTVRRTRDHRILMRNTIGYARDVTLRDVDWEAIRRNHWRSIAARYPDFADIEIEHTWGGVMGNTMNEGQFFGQLEERVYASVAYNGVGVAMGTASGGALADLAVGNETETIAELRKLRAPAWLAPNPFLAIGVWTSLAWLQWRAGNER